MEWLLIPLLKKLATDDQKLDVNDHQFPPPLRNVLDSFNPITISSKYKKRTCGTSSALTANLHVLERASLQPAATDR